MTTDPHDEHGEILRRALRAEAESVSPAPDGLERIRARIDERSRRRFAWDWFSVGGWQRPALALGAAAFLLALGVSAPQTFDRITSAGDNGPADQGRSSAAAGVPPSGVSSSDWPQQPPGSGRPGERPSDGKSTALPNAVPGSPTCGPGGDQSTAAGTPASPPAETGDEKTKKQPCPPGGEKPSPNPSTPTPPNPDPTPSTEPTSTGSPQQQPPGG